MDVHARLNALEPEMLDALKMLVSIKSVEGKAAPGAPYGVGPAKALKAALELAE